MLNINNYLSIYVHFPFCISKCFYCDFFSIECNNNSLFDDYLIALENELKYRIKDLGTNKCRTVYIGGGTPSLLSFNQISKICNILNENIFFTDDYEFTLEVNSDDVSKEFILFLNDTKINRISCGLQSFCNKSLKFVNRRADKKQNIKAVKLINKYWKKDTSFDLIAGLPFENKSLFCKKIKMLCKHKISHISLYSLTVEEDTKLGKLIENNIVSYDFDFSDEIWFSAKNILEMYGYIQYEVSNFSLKDKESKHNLVYWNHQSYLGIGSGATGTYYNQDGSACRFTNTKNIQKYIGFWKTAHLSSNFNQNLLEDVQVVENVSVENSIFEFFMMGLRKTKGVSKLYYEKSFNRHFPKQIEAKFYEYEKKGMANIIKEKEDTRFLLNKKGILFLNQFLQEIDF